MATTSSSSNEEEDDDAISKTPTTTTVEKKRKSPLTPPNNNLSEDELLVKSFMDILQLKIDAGLLHSPTGLDRQGLDQALRPGLYWGMAVGCLQFLFLRRAPIVMMNRIVRQQTAPIREQPNRLLPHSTINEGQRHFREGLLVKPITMALDIGLSLLTTGLVWFSVTNKKKLFQGASDIPLHEGASPISSVLCPDFIQQADRVPERVWKDNQVDNDAVLHLHKFVDNCRRRAHYQRVLRRERGLMMMEGGDDGETEIIPTPGVPADYPLQEEPEVDWASLDYDDYFNNNNNADIDEDW